jgi:hypothetical protein
MEPSLPLTIWMTEGCAWRSDLVRADHQALCAVTLLQIAD